MHKLVKHSITAAVILASAGTAPATAQGVRARPVIRPTGPVKPITTPPTKVLTQAELVARMKPAPRFLNGSELKAKISTSNIASAVPDLESAFSLTPAVQSVAGRGSMTIDGDVMVPNPLPPGFPGQATIRYQMIGFGSAGWYGGVRLKLKAQKGLFYAVDCLTAITTTETPNVYFSIRGSDSSQSGAVKVDDGHVVFNVRRTADTGDIDISFRPDELEKIKDWSGQMADENVMDF